MSNVLIEKDKLDILATAISNKSGEPLKLTLDEMVEAVDGIETGGGEPNLQAKTYNVSSAGTATVTADSGYDGLSEVEVNVPSADVGPSFVDNFITQNNARKWAVTYGADLIDTGWLGASVEHSSTFNAVPTNTTITPTESSQTIGGANYMMEGAVTVGAISSTYVGTGVTRQSAKTVTPTESSQTAVASGVYTTGAVTVAPIPYADGDNEAYGHGEIWLINATPTVLQSKNWNVDFISNGNIYIKISLGYVMVYPQVIYANNSNTEVYFNGTWADQAYRTIEITGGTDKDNAEFRAWLEANAVRQ